MEQKYQDFKNNQAHHLFETLSRVSMVESTIPENVCDSNHLLNRNTESFKCLAQLLVSSSSITRNRLYLFPPLEDPGIKIAFEFIDPKLKADNIGIEEYKKLCNEANIVPISRVIRSLHTDTLNLKCYGLTTKQLWALMSVMKGNTYILNLILEENWLSPEMVQLVSDAVVENMMLQYLSLRECRIGIEGAKIFGDILSSLQSLRTLDLKSNSIEDEGLQYMKDGLCGNTSLKQINLSNNKLTEESANVLEGMFLENKIIEDLDLSWNNFQTPACAKKMFLALKKTDSLRRLNISWNGIEDPLTIRPFAKYIRASHQLQELDISNNRLQGRALKLMREAIHKNSSLDTIKIGNNIYPPEEAHLLLITLSSKAKDPLNYMDMENMWITKESKPVLAKIKVMGKVVKIGGILSDYEVKGPDIHKVYYDRARYILTKTKRANARKDFGHAVLSLPENSATPEEFEKTLKKLKMKKLLKETELVKGLESLFVKTNKTINTNLLVDDYMTYFPESTPPPPKPKKRKNAKKKKRKKGKNKLVKN